jgi:hypothetical protein
MSVELKNSIIMDRPKSVPLGADTELFRFPVTLDPGQRLVRLSVFGGLFFDNSFGKVVTKTFLQAFGLVKPTSDVYHKVVIVTGGIMGIFVSNDPTEFITKVTGGQKEIVISINLNLVDPPWPPGGGVDLCTTGNMLTADYAWQAVLEDLGPA